MPITLFGKSMTLRCQIACMFVPALGGCAAVEIHPSHLQEVAAAAQRVAVDVSDGVSEIEAYRIASDHPAGRFSGSLGGGLFALKDEGSAWRASFQAGIVGQIRTDIVIRKADGHVVVEQIDPPPQKPNQTPEPTRFARGSS